MKTTSEILDAMLKADEPLYCRCLDTPGFAKAFNDLARRANLADMLIGGINTIKRALVDSEAS